MSNLFAFGCSNTYGEGLKDTANFAKKDMPVSKFAWPQLLADKLSLTCNNYSAIGASNKQISKTILDNVDKIKKDDVIIVLWSYLSRWCIFRDNDIERLAYWASNKNSEFWVKNLYNQADRNFENKIFIDYIYLFLKERGLKFYFIIPDKETFNAITFDNAKFLTVTFDSIKNHYPKGFDNNHVGEEGHIAFTNEIYKEIKDTAQ